jgi:polar amino acid transport system ATP-binding protein
MKLKISALTKTYGSHRALDAVSLSIENTQSLVLLGPSGGGKSTLLRILAGLESPEAGDVEINGQPIAFDEKALLQHRRGIGVVFQAFNLFPHLSALHNITLPLVVVLGLSQADAEAVAVGLLKRFQLEKHGHKKPVALSGGQRQRIAIARALATRPALLLFDEPTSALDPEMTAEVLDMIGELRAEGRNLILVTHELAFAKQVADQIAILAAGKIVETGTPQQIFENPQHEATRSFFRRTLKY